MFIYILNLLHEGLIKKKINICERSDFKIIKDTYYITQLAGIKKSFDFKNITDKIIDVFEILNKYNITSQESIGIFNTLIRNNENLWIAEYFNNGDEKSELVLSSIINNIFEKKQKDIYTYENNLLGKIVNVG